MKRIRLSFTPGLEVWFADREAALKRIEEWAEKGIVNVKVVFGPEGCGKTAWLRQAAMLLKELGFHVVYVDPLRRDFAAYTDLEFARRLAEAASDALAAAPLRLATLALDFGDYALRAGKRRVAILVDGAFQAIGLDRAAMYVKALLNLIEYPPRSYERIITIATTSEGVSRREIGRHRWAELLPMWNMSKEGFRELYSQIPGEKPDFEYTWKLTGGNPKLLGELYKAGWNKDRVLDAIAALRRLRSLIARLSHEERAWLREAVEDPDTLFTRERMHLLDRLVELNLILDDIPYRREHLWVDSPPPEKDPELGIGKHAAWQTPMHREAARKILEEHGK